MTPRVWLGSTMLAVVAVVGCDGNVAPPVQPTGGGGDTVISPSPLCSALNGMAGNGGIDMGFATKSPFLQYRR